MKKKYSVIYTISFLLSPFFTILICLRRYKERVAQFFFVIAATFWGYTINPVGDLERYSNYFYLYGSLNTAELFEKAISFDISDFYILCIAKLTYSIGFNVNLYFALLVGIYSFIYISIIRIILEHVRLDNKLYELLFILFATFFSIRSFFSIRFSTALLLTIYLMLSFVFKRDKKYLYALLVTPFIHIAFIFVCFLGPALFYFKNRMKLSFIIVLLSFIPTRDTFIVLYNYLPQLQESKAIDSKYDSYVSDDGYQELAERYEQGAKEANIKLKSLNLTKEVFRYLCVFGVIYVYFKRRYLLKTYESYTIFSIVLLLLALANLLNNISNGVRFQNIWILLYLSLLLFIELSYKKRSLLFNYYLKLLIFIGLLANLMTLYAANTLFTYDYFFSNYFLEFIKLV